MNAQLQTIVDKIIKTDEMTSNSFLVVNDLSILPEAKEKYELSVFKHHIYEYKKGLRNLVLTTEKAQNESFIKRTLEKNKISYTIHHISQGKINVYFGAKECVDVVKTFNPKLNEISPSEDFILGIMLGYDRLKQCKRYLKIKESNFGL